MAYPPRCRTWFDRVRTVGANTAACTRAFRGPAFISGEKTLFYEQNLARRKISLVCPSAVLWPVIEPFVGIIVSAVLDHQISHLGPVNGSIDSHVALPRAPIILERNGEKGTETLAPASKQVEREVGEMKIGLGVVSGLIAVAFVAPPSSISAPAPNTTGVRTQLVITVRSAQRGGAPESLVAGDVTVEQGDNHVPVVGLQRLAGSMADMQLFVLLDDSTRSSGLGVQLPELKTFLTSLPGTTQVAIGYMRNGTFVLLQGFTADHRKAIGALRLPIALPGENGSPYFALSDLAKHWPSKQSTGRRAVLMLTDGVDRYYDTAVVDDPYVDAAIHDALKHGVMVYSIYLRGAGLYGRGDWQTTIAQSRLIDVSEETGGHAYFMGFTDPVNISPFLNDFQDRLANQFELTIAALDRKGVQPVKLRTELPGVVVQGPTHIYVP